MQYHYHFKPEPTGSNFYLEFFHGLQHNQFLEDLLFAIRVMSPKIAGSETENNAATLYLIDTDWGPASVTLYGKLRATMNSSSLELLLKVDRQLQKSGLFRKMPVKGHLREAPQEETTEASLRRRRMFKKINVFKILGSVLVTYSLTMWSQIGGMVYLLNLILYPFINRNVHWKWLRWPTKVTLFLSSYLSISIWLLPYLAAFSGRVPLPYNEEKSLRPLNRITCMLNRHYVQPFVYTVLFDVAAEMDKFYPGTTINYLDGNFPLFPGFPVMPHLSHRDGKKLDLAFYYMHNGSRERTNECPSLIGYGICEEARQGEINTAEFCEDNGYWQYSIMRKIVPQYAKDDYIFDVERTRALLVLLTQHPRVKKILLEPHLRFRLGLKSEKIGFHGCEAVRHDDHIHVEFE